MSLFDRIANYFKEWDGIDETAPKMELDIHELRYIANMKIECGRLIKQLNEANLKTEALLLDKAQEIRAKTIDELKNKVCMHFADWKYSEDDKCIKDIIELASESVEEIAEQMKGEKYGR